MGRESTITFEQISAVADAMKTEGVKGPLQETDHSVR